jgi:hypothetical protein
MLQANVMIHASDTALHNLEVALDCVGVNVAAHILADAMIDGVMTRRTVTRPRAAAIARGARSIGNLFIHNRVKRHGGHVRGVMRPRLPSRSTSQNIASLPAEIRLLRCLLASLLST